MFGWGRKPFDPARFDAAWECYLRAIEKSHPPFRTLFAAGADASAVDRLERDLSLKLPSDLRHLLGKHAGSLGEQQVLPGWELFSPVRIGDEWRIWEELRRTEFVPDDITCDPEGPIKPDEWWRLAWIPFTGDGGGNHLCVDMDPARGGTAGQVITMWHDDATRALIAPSLTDFIEILARDAESGSITWDADWGGVQATPDT